MWRSVPQIEATLTFTRTSERPKAGILTSRTSAPGAASGLTTASIVPAIIATYDLMPKTRVDTKHTIVALRTRSNWGPVLFSCGPGCRYHRVPCGLAPPHQAVAGDVAGLVPAGLSCLGKRLTRSCTLPQRS